MFQSCSWGNQKSRLLTESLFWCGYQHLKSRHYDTSICPGALGYKGGLFGAQSSLARRLIYELKYRKDTKPVVSFGIFFYTSHIYIYLHQIYVPNLSVGVMSLTLAKWIHRMEYGQKVSTLTYPRTLHIYFTSNSGFVSLCIKVVLVETRKYFKCLRNFQKSKAWFGHVDWQLIILN